MRPIRYHDGQRDVQREAGTSDIADRLTTLPPVREFFHNADLFVFALARQETKMVFSTLSGLPPLVQIVEVGDDLRLQLPSALADHLSTGTKCGGILINLALAMRSRISGTLSIRGDQVELLCQTGTRNCRKYIAPSVPITDAPGMRIGPSSRQLLSLESPLINEILAKAETSFLATITPAGMPDVSHRGGAPGFLAYDASTHVIQWSEYIGSGMFMSTGNLRANSEFLLLVLEIDTGNGLELRGQATYTMDRSRQREPSEGLTQEREAYPARGVVKGVVIEATLSKDVCHPRQRVAQRGKVTACSPIEEQSTRYLANTHGYTEINVNHNEVA